jgi:hypothetical protein
MSWHFFPHRRWNSETLNPVPWNPGCTFCGISGLACSDVSISPYVWRIW